MSNPVLQIDELSRSFGERAVVRALTLHVDAGERVALVGPNGSGKSTLLRCVLGTMDPSSGSVRIGGERAGTLAARALVGATLAQDRSFYLRLSGHENLNLFARLRFRDSVVAAGKVAAVVHELGIEDIASRRLDRCSTGMVQQLGFARALLGEPPLLLLDEPTRSLDGDAAERLWAAIDRRPDQAVVIATHRPDDVARCHRSVEFPA